MQIEIQERQKHQEGKETKTFWTKSDIFKKLKSHFFRCACVSASVLMCVCVWMCVSERGRGREREGACAQATKRIFCELI